MARKKRYRGHYCKVCNQILPNEKFTGRGHNAHICKKCTQKPVEQRSEEIILNRINRWHGNMSLPRENRRKLEKYSRSPRENIRLAALDALNISKTYSFYKRRKRSIKTKKSQN